MSGHNTLEVSNRPFESYGRLPENKPRVDGDDNVVGDEKLYAFEENIKFMREPVFPTRQPPPHNYRASPTLPAELSSGNYRASPTLLAELSSSNYRTSPTLLAELSSSNYSASSTSQKATQSDTSSQYFPTYPIGKSQSSTFPRILLNNESQETPTNKKRRKWYIIGGIVLTLVVIAAGVVGGVLASRKGTNTVAHAAPNVTSPSDPSISTNSIAAPFQRNIAALSYTAGSTNVTQVYYQDNLGNIIEAVNSAPTTAWSHSTVTSAQNGSAFAAAVSMPNYSFETTLIYTDSNDIIHDIIYNASSGSWNAGVLSAQKYIIAPNSSLAVMYWQCILCFNTTVIAFQDVNNNIQFGNLTESGWSLTQINVDVVANTGLALQRFPRRNQADQINLYYQATNSNLTISAWGYGTGWKLNAASYKEIAMRAQVSASTSYATVEYTGTVLTGFAFWQETLVLSDSGIAVNTYSGPHNDWQGMGIHPSAMSNSTNNVKTFKSMAVTAIGAAFAVVGREGEADVIESYQVEDDTINWSSTAVVDIDGVWG